MSANKSTNQPDQAKRFPPKNYPSQIGHKDFFWIRDCVTGLWVLGRTLRFKNGRAKSTWIEHKCVLLEPEPPEPELRKIFAQFENDLSFELSAGQRPPSSGAKDNFRQHLQEVYALLQGSNKPQ